MTHASGSACTNRVRIMAAVGLGVAAAGVLRCAGEYRPQALTPFAMGGDAAAPLSSRSPGDACASDVEWRHVSDAAEDASSSDHDESVTAAEGSRGASGIGSVGYYTWIYRAPSRADPPIGYVRPGVWLHVVSELRVPGTECASGRWVEVQPKGYVCEDGTVVRDASDPLFAALRALVPSSESTLSYRYAYSLGAPMYGRIPSLEEQARVERIYPPAEQIRRRRRPQRTYEDLALDTLPVATDPMPEWFASGREAPRMRGRDSGLVRKHIPMGSLLAFARAFVEGGRTFLLTPDLTLVPAERVRPFRQTEFQGVELGDGIGLPLAWTRSEPGPKYRATPSGTLEKSNETWPPRAVILLTGAQRVDRGVKYWETRDRALFASERDVSVLQAAEPPPVTLRADEKWIDFSITRGTLTLYVGGTPVFSTLASPGIGGAPSSPRLSVEELVQGGHTPLGLYRITYKTQSTTMTPERTPEPKKHWIAEVPYAQYFRQPFAIHAAYWHEDFGMPKSGGCINLSPEDARRVYAWTDPAPVPGWSGVSSGGAAGLGTLLRIRR